MSNYLDNAKCPRQSKTRADFEKRNTITLETWRTGFTFTVAPGKQPILISEGMASKYFYIPIIGVLGNVVYTQPIEQGSIAWAMLENFLYDEENLNSSWTPEGKTIFYDGLTGCKLSSLQKKVSLERMEPKREIRRILCECGAHAIGIKDHMQGHSDWCPAK